MPEIHTTSTGLHAVRDDLRAPWAEAALPIILHHGIGTTHAIWSEWVPVLAGRHAVWRFDMRGFGRSACPDEGHVWSIDGLIADVVSVIALTGAPRVHLMGESMGGSIVLATALARPDLVASVQISNASYKGKGLGELGYWHAQFADGGPKGWSRRMMANRFAPGVGDPAGLAWFEAEQARTRPHVALGLGSVLAGLDLTERLPELAVPLSVVLPDRSPFVPVAHGMEHLTLVPGARLRVVPDTRHGLPFSHARIEARHYLRFLATCGALPPR